MGKNYFKIAIRGLWRNKLYTAINLAGLSIAIACALIAYINWDYARSYNQFHRNYDSIYRVISLRPSTQVSTRQGIVPLPLTQALRRDFPSLERVVQMEWANSTVRKGEHVFEEGILYTDPGFFQMFTFPLETGRADLGNKSQVVISRDCARKYFGGANPLGQVLTSTFGNGYSCQLVVSAVARNCPANSSIRFDLLTSAELLLDAGINKSNDWSMWTSAIFLQTGDSRVIPVITAKLQQYLAPQRAANTRTPLSGYDIEPLREVASRANSNRNDALQESTPSSHVIGIGVMGGLMLLMACFNFVNTALAFAGRRLREIGIRKVMGSRRFDLITQFLSENILLCLLALGAGLLLTRILLPYFNDLYPFVNLTLDLTGNLRLLGVLLLLLLFTACGAGLYPAWIITATQPVSVLSGQTKSGRLSFMMRTLLTAQFALAILAIIGCAVFSDNAEFNRNFDYGYRHTELVTIPVTNGAAFRILQNQLSNDPDVEQTAGAQRPIFYSGARRTIRGEGADRETMIYEVGFNYLETMGVRLMEGRLFQEKTASDQQDAVVISRLLAQELGWKKAAGKILTLDDKSCQVVGVVEDIFVQGSWRPLAPLLFRLAGPGQLTTLQARVRPGTENRVLDKLRSAWLRLFPDQTFGGFSENPLLNNAILLSENIQTNFNAIGFACITIACIGLFALVSIHIAGRAREFSIRKILGASVSHLAGLVNRDFLLMLAIAMIIGDVAGYFSYRLLMGAIFTYHTAIGGTALMLANLLVFALAAATISQRVWQSVTANPVKALRHE